MTVIAAKQGIMSGDRAFSKGDHMFMSTKPKIIHPHPDILIGFAGDGKLGQDLLEIDWPPLLSRPVVNKLIFKKLGDYDEELEILFCIGPLVYSWDAGVWLEHDYFAIGTGAGIAIGAMAHGATPDQAVAYAILHTASCGGNIDTFSVVLA